jgi:uncharacterized protein YdgA (DUF945 family)
MNRNAIIGIAVVALVPVYVGLSWATGQAAHSRVNAWEQEVASQAGHIYRIAERQKQQGLFSSTETITFELSPEFAAAMQGTSADGESGKPFRLTLRNDLQHGPLPGLRSLGLARIETRVVLDEKTAAELQKELGVTEPFVAVTRVGFLGGGTTTVTSPAFKKEMKPGEIIEWRGFEAKFSFDGTLDSFECDARAPGLIGRTGDQSIMTFEDLTFDCDFERVFDELYAGDASFAWKRMHVNPEITGSGSSMQMDDLRYTVRASASGDYYDAALDASVGSFVMDKVTITDLAYQLALKHLHGKTLAGMSKKYQEATQSMAFNDPMAGAQVAGILAEFGPTLLEHSPELVIERIGFRMPEGEFGIKGSLKVLEITQEELQALQSPMQLLSKLEAAFDVWVSQGLLEKDWDALSAGTDTPGTESIEGVQETPAARSQTVEMMRQQVAAMEQAGYVKRNGGRLESRIEFKNGALTANGKPVGPGM